MKKTLTTFLRGVFAIMVISFNSCTLEDHVVPEPNEPTDWEISASALIDGPSVTFSAIIDKKGSKKLKELVILASSHTSEWGAVEVDPKFPANFNPLLRSLPLYLSGSEMDPEPNAGEKRVTTILLSFSKLYYRAAARVENANGQEEIVYGKVMQAGNNLANPVSWEISSEFGIDGMTGTIVKGGSIPVLRYGFVANVAGPGDVIPNNPTLGNNNAGQGTHHEYIVSDTDFHDPGDALLYGGGSFFKDDNFGYVSMYFRAFIELQDGTVVYGNVVTVNK